MENGLEKLGYVLCPKRSWNNDKIFIRNIEYVEDERLKECFYVNEEYLNYYKFEENYDCDGYVQEYPQKIMLDEHLIINQWIVEQLEKRKKEESI